MLNPTTTITMAKPHDALFEILTQNGTFTTQVFNIFVVVQMVKKCSKLRQKNELLSITMLQDMFVESVML